MSIFVVVRWIFNHKYWSWNDWNICFAITVAQPIIRSQVCFYQVDIACSGIDGMDGEVQQTGDDWFEHCCMRKSQPEIKMFKLFCSIENSVQCFHKKTLFGDSMQFTINLIESFIFWLFTVNIIILRHLWP